MPPPPPAAGEPPIPWEQPGYPALVGLYETTKLFLTAPQEAFRRMPVIGELGRPLGYAILLGWIGIIAGQAYQIALGGTMRSWMAPFSQGQDLDLGVGFNIAMMVSAPLLILIAGFVGQPSCTSSSCWSAATTRASRRRPDGVLRELPAVLQIIPLCGRWSPGLDDRPGGHRAGHRAPTSRARPPPPC
jgi:hypothetical protein